MIGATASECWMWLRLTKCIWLWNVSHFLLTVRAVGSTNRARQASKAARVHSWLSHLLRGKNGYFLLWLAKGEGWIWGGQHCYFGRYRRYEHSTSGQIRWLPGLLLVVREASFATADESLPVHVLCHRGHTDSITVCLEWYTL